MKMLHRRTQKLQESKGNYQEEQMLPKKPTILLADDDPSMLKLLSRVLETEDYQVVTTYDSTSVLELTAQRKSLALVILELEAIEQQGIRVCRRLREFSQVPIIILVGKYDEDDVVHSLDAGADDFITKPFGMGEFVARVKAVLRRSDFPGEYRLSS